MPDRMATQSAQRIAAPMTDGEKPPIVVALCEVLEEARTYAGVTIYDVASHGPHVTTVSNIKNGKIGQVPKTVELILVAYANATGVPVSTLRQRWAFRYLDLAKIAGDDA